MNREKTDLYWEEEIYARGRHFNRYPYDIVVSCIFRWCPRDKPRGETNILEVGSGAGNNLWFAAREGFKVAGIDGSTSAIAYARKRFVQERLEADLRVGNFLDLPWSENSFDLAIDRCSLTCAGLEDQRKAVGEIHRVLRPGSVFLYNCYSDRHTSAHSGTRLPDGRISEITEGALAGIEGLHFSSRNDVESLFSIGWEVLKIDHLILQDLSPVSVGDHAEWRLIVRKK